MGRGCWAAANPPPKKQNLKNADFVDEMVLKVLRDLRFGLNQPVKSADD
jgi:hypothetical protein